MEHVQWFHDRKENQDHNDYVTEPLPIHRNFFKHLKTDLFLSHPEGAGLVKNILLNDMPAIGDMPYLQLIRQLEAMQKELCNNPDPASMQAVHDKFWYAQKIGELKTLREHFEQATHRVIELRNLMDGHYHATRKCYKHDLRVINRQRKKAQAHVVQLIVG